MKNLTILIFLLLHVGVSVYAQMSNPATVPLVGNLKAGDKLPVPLNLEEVKARMGYPKMAWEAEIEGLVVVRFIVEANGSVGARIVLRDPHPLLVKAVQNCLDSLMFSPAIIDSRAQATWVTMPFDFRLLGGKVLRAPVIDSHGLGCYSMNDVRQYLAAGAADFVTEVHLDGAGLKEFPDEILQFRNLEILDLSRCSIWEIPDKVGSFENLKELLLYGNPVRKLPDSILELDHLQVLGLSGLPISAQDKELLEKKFGEKLYPRKTNGKVLW